MFNMLNKIDQKLRKRLEFVAVKAVEFGDRGVVEWANRAAQDALFLGRMRDRDVANLQRLEATYNDDFYSGNAPARSGELVYA
jgi:hypothetical protein